MTAPSREEPPAPRRTERMAGLFLLAAVLFSPPLLDLFGVEGTVLGVPVLYAGVFGIWAAVILLAALASRTR
ncbi:hypothetical protein [Azospirillum ramasamyi]|uniref:DUF3311 domain-containing protein n=1 Tax=Azospirillum ramasamyi TaxID=682998 RepID=A0A2U9S3Z4_9PROT|nr:hypothetical protein [Azospirillum ramasamyi]AWU94310.1 hypothetical protein DM194_08560 [Azospirillum ramasamyi]